MVISETRKYPHQIDSGVLTFFHAHQHVQFYLSVITLGELYKGHHELLRRGATRKATELLAWIVQLRTQYVSRIIPFGEHDAEQWGEFLGNDSQHQVDKPNRLQPLPLIVAWRWSPGTPSTCHKRRSYRRRC